MTCKPAKCFKFQFLRGIADSNTYSLCIVDGKSTTGRSVYIQSTVVCDVCSTFHINKWRYLLLAEIASDICENRNIDLTVSYVKWNVHAFGLIRRHEMQTSTRTKE